MEIFSTDVPLTTALIVIAAIPPILIAWFVGSLFVDVITASFRTIFLTVPLMTSPNKPPRPCSVSPAFTTISCFILEIV